MALREVIDADAHVIESNEMWDYLEGADRKFRPMGLLASTGPSAHRFYWIYDGNVGAQHASPNLPEGVKFLTDIPARLKAMDAMGIDLQVLYPTLLLIYTVMNVETSVAICRCYNRFVADQCAKSAGRLRWAIVPPVESMPDALAELESGAKHGACAITIHGLEGGRTLADPYFYPLFQKASDLNLPICVHVGNGNIPMTPSLRSSSVFFTRGPVLGAFHDLLIGGIPDKFPKLRFGFIEAGAEWIPWIIAEVMRRKGWMISQPELSAYAMGEETVRQLKGRGEGVDPATIMPDSRLYVSCRINEDLNYLMRWAGRGNLVTGTDYGHEDYSKELEAFKILEEKKIYDAEMIEGIRGRNAKALYGL